ncbi:hypothetical protein [Spirosoma flavum]|uniref:Uncharacterized protein n=1 Tax=Spirosoma flavum TaxID=2048557 RepID=A0ABW6AM15_9BACT
MSDQIGNSNAFLNYVWYPATLMPPDDFLDDDNQQMIIVVEGIGIISGFYSLDKKSFYMHCQRYDSHEDKSTGGLTRQQEINRNLNWVVEPTSQVTHWMLVELPT